MNNNPSPGNKAGGLTTILEKSLGAAAKGGTTNLDGVYKYAEPITEQGLRLHGQPRLRPGLGDRARWPAAATSSPSPPAAAPASASSRRRRSRSPPTPPCTAAWTRTWTSTAGTIVDGEETIEQVGQRIFDLVVAVAGGEQSKSEELGVGDNEFVPWQIGAVM